MCTSLFLRSGPFSCLLTQTPNPSSLFPSISFLHTRLTGQGGMGRRWELPLERGSGQHSVKYQPLAVGASNTPSPSYCLLEVERPRPKGRDLGFYMGLLRKPHYSMHTQNDHTFFWNAGDFKRICFSIQKKHKENKNDL